MHNKAGLAKTVPRYQIQLFDAATGKVQQAIKNAKGFGFTQFSPDGWFLTCAEKGQDICRYESLTGNFVDRWLADPKNICSLAYSADGQLLATASESGPIYLWHLPTHTKIHEYPGHGFGNAYALAFSPDGTKLVSGGYDTTALIWDVKPALQQLSKVKVVKLTPAELDQHWQELSDQDAGKAYQAAGQMIAAPEQAVAFLEKGLVPAKKIEAAEIKQWIADLDSASYAVRQNATVALANAGGLALVPLQQSLKKPPSVEFQLRVEQLLQKMESQPYTPQTLQRLRAVYILQQIGSAKAVGILEGLAKGHTDALLTTKAQAALRYLKKAPAESVP